MSQTSSSKEQASVYSYATGEALAGAPSPQLVKASRLAEPTGAVRARRDLKGVWQWAAADDAAGTITVYVS